MAWDEPSPNIPVMVLLYGPGKVGKTHFACFATQEPVYIADSDKRADIPMLKAVAEGRRIHRKLCSSRKDVKLAVSQALQDAIARQQTEGAAWKPGTFVFDSASDLQDFAEDEYLEESKTDKLYPRVVYKRVYDKIDHLFEPLKNLGFNVLFLGREGEEWKGDSPTGKKRFSGYKRLPFKADIVLRASIDKGPTGAGETGPWFYVENNGLTLGGPKALDARSLTWQGMMKALVAAPNKLESEA